MCCLSYNCDIIISAIMDAHTGILIFRLFVGALVVFALVTSIRSQGKTFWGTIKDAYFSPKSKLSKFQRRAGYVVMVLTALAACGMIWVTLVGIRFYFFDSF